MLSCGAWKIQCRLLNMLYDFSTAAKFDTLPKLLQNFNLIIRDTIEPADFIFIRTLFVKNKLSAVDIAKGSHFVRVFGLWAGESIIRCSLPTGFIYIGWRIGQIQWF